MVFIALPNMQMSQRNTRRKNDYSALSTQVTTYVSNNNGAMPTDAKKIQRAWLNSDGTDPDGNYYNIGLVDCPTTSTTASNACGVKASSNASSNANELSRTSTAVTTINADNVGTQSHQVYVITSATCSGAQPVYKSGKRNFVIYGYVETRTSGIDTANDHYCLASHG